MAHLTVTIGHVAPSRSEIRGPGLKREHAVNTAAAFTDSKVPRQPRQPRPVYPHDCSPPPQPVHLGRRDYLRALPAIERDRDEMEA